MNARNSLEGGRRCLKRSVCECYLGTFTALMR
jgi:hypothetical protein